MIMMDKSRRRRRRERVKFEFPIRFAYLALLPWLLFLTTCCPVPEEFEGVALCSLAWERGDVVVKLLIIITVIPKWDVQTRFWYANGIHPIQSWEPRRLLVKVQILGNNLRISACHRRRSFDTRQLRMSCYGTERHDTQLGIYRGGRVGLIKCRSI